MRPLVLSLPVALMAASFLPAGVGAQADTAKPAPQRGGGLEATLVANERRLWELFAKKDVAGIKRFIAPRAVSVYASGIHDFDPERIAACEIKNYELGDFRVVRVSADAGIVTYSATQDVTCGDHKGPAKVFASTTWVRRGGRWLSLFRQESPAP